MCEDRCFWCKSCFFLFQAGLVGVLVSKFRMTIGVTFAYLALCVGFHVWTLVSKYTFILHVGPSANVFGLRSDSIRTAIFILLITYWFALHYSNCAVSDAFFKQRFKIQCSSKVRFTIIFRRCDGRSLDRMCGIQAILCSLSCSDQVCWVLLSAYSVALQKRKLLTSWLYHVF